MPSGAHRGCPSGFAAGPYGPSDRCACASGHRVSPSPPGVVQSPPGCGLCRRSFPLLLGLAPLPLCLGQKARSVCPNGFEPRRLHVFHQRVAAHARLLQYPVGIETRVAPVLAERLALIPNNQFNPPRGPLAPVLGGASHFASPAGLLPCRNSLISRL